MGWNRNNLAVVAGVLATAVACARQPAMAQVSGRVQIRETGGRASTDLGDAVVYLDGRGPRGAAPRRPEMTLDARQFRPRVLVVPVGTAVSFPNLDPFNHNVFSSGDTAFDLGLYGRGSARGRRFTRAGVVRLFCNIHPRMVGFVVVRDNPWYTQPGADGGFTIPDVPAGTYTLKVWHERAPEISQTITVGAGGLVLGAPLVLDGTGYVFAQHANKYGQAYGTARERY